MQIAASTKISALIKENPAAIEAIASINKHFEKLRNPLLRKVLASRVTIADAARIGGCEVERFYEKLAPLGFTVAAGKSTESMAQPVYTSNAELPAFLANLPAERLRRLDVCADIATGNDPFRKIMAAVDKVEENSALLLINTFEPTPLMAILKKKGYSYFTEEKSPDLVHTYFWRNGAAEPLAEESIKPAENNFEDTLARFAGKVKRVDVRHLEMPQPMVTILGELEKLPAGEALYVVHKRVPQFLLPQLDERGFHVAINEVGPNEVYLLIYREPTSEV
ncbi:DUF2249 domain-containing protein [Pontibacter chinhatensis]|uniref:DUF2249 domain-containing protein n=1 Tax=Pontibacter chinhatensis TaxID=1436961 RepID=A0A1I2S1T4_9BACT|nr:DUF2249 domain-containing protein [Pontibacter chinhatensis]SFG46293.1 protein of unknown function [Pontibacter chinhatensis]